MNWLLPITYHVERAEKRRQERERIAAYLRQFGPPQSKAYNRVAKQLSRARSRGEPLPI